MAFSAFCACTCASACAWPAIQPPAKPPCSIGIGYVVRPGKGKLMTRVGFGGEESRRALDDEDRDEDFLGAGSTVNRHMTITTAVSTP